MKSKTATVESISPPNKSDIEKAIHAAGYEIGEEHKPMFSRNPTDYKDFFVGVVVVGVLGILYTVFGFDRSLSTGNISSGGLGVALITGLVAGLSTCMALVGGLVLGLSARHAKKHPAATTMQKFRPHLYFNLSQKQFARKQEVV